MNTVNFNYLNTNSLSFEGKKKKVNKEHPKREKIKENAKKVALFIAGLATLGIVTVKMSSKNEKINNQNEAKNPIVEEQSEKKEKTENKQTEPKTINTVKAPEEQSALEAPEPILISPECSETLAEEILDEIPVEDAIVQGEDDKIVYFVEPELTQVDTEETTTEQQKDDKKADTTCGDLPSSKVKGDESVDFSKSNEQMQKILDENLSKFIEDYSEYEKKTSENLKKQYEKQSSTIADLLNKSLELLEEDDGFNS